MKRLDRDLLLNISTSFGKILLNFSAKIILARYFEKSELATYYFILDTILVASAFSSGLKDALIHLYEKSKINVKRMFAKYTVLFLLVSVVLVPVALITLGQKVNIVWPNLLLYSVLGLLILINLPLTFLVLAERKFKAVSFKDVFTASIWFVSVVFICLFGIKSHIYLCIAHGMIQLFLMVYLSYALRSTNSFKDWKAHYREPAETSFKKEFANKTGLASFDYGVNSLVNYGSSLFLLFYFSIEDLANFQVVARPIFNAIITTLSFPVFRIYFSKSSYLVNTGQAGEIIPLFKNFLRYLLLPFTVLCFLSYFIVEPFIEIAFTEKYTAAFHLAYIYILATPIIILRSFLYALLKAKGKFVNIVYLRCLQFSIFIGLLYMFYQWDSSNVDSLGYSFLISNAVSVFIATVLVLGIFKNLKKEMVS